VSSPSIGEVRQYYDGFAKSLLADYVHGNPRIEAAIRHALRWLPAGAGHILDVGCGVGWSSWEIKRHRPAARVVGLDLSGDMVRIAEALFPAAGLSFVAAEIAEWTGGAGAPLDAVVMLDVYEHIPRARRAALHLTVSRLLGASGRIVLSFPSIAHQAWLRQHAPGGLQPVDEDVAEEDVASFAREVGGRVAHLAPVSIWRPGDYLHATIERGETVAGRPRPAAARPSALESKSVRAGRAHDRLGVRVTRPGVLLPDRDGPVVCVVSPNRIEETESFIRAQLERLPARVRLLHHGWLPTLDDEDQPIVLLRALARAALPAVSRLLGVEPARLGSRLARSCPRPARVRALCDWLRRSGARVVLAQYGPTGVSVLDACRAAEVPLVVHFHGFDAYEHQTLASFGRDYPRLFQRAAGLIAVSRDMEYQLLRLGAPRETLHYAPCGVDLERFAGADPGAARPLFVAVGRFVDKKAPHLTLEAFARAAAACPEARLVMLGTGERLEACRRLTRDLQLQDRVEFAGERPPAEVATTLRGARAFVQHSLTAAGGDREGTPVAVLEASASGLPVIATRHGGIKEAVLEGESGLLVDEGDVEGMARHMVTLARDPALAAALGRRGRQHMAEHFAMSQSIERLWRVLDSVVRGDGAAHPAP
jgi:glycosyltransferase involved in cell wall biosynthesis